MVDYVGMVINSTFTGIGAGMGVILANQFWQWLNKYREKMKKHINELKKDLLDEQ
jgi:hypothetical protein